MNRVDLSLLLIILIIHPACTRGDPTDFPDPITDLKPDPDRTTARLVLAGGCFWCTEAVFEHVPGVINVVSGYTGGSQHDANYQAVSTGNTKHAEAIEITYDPRQISFGKLLKVFFSVAHDPTQLNRQGPDVGRQYRSAIFYTTEQQKQIAQTYIDQLNKTGVFDRPIVTTLEPLTEFFPAEDYHQDYARQNPDQPYVSQQVPPKMMKLHQLYPPVTTRPSATPSSSDPEKNRPAD